LLQEDFDGYNGYKQITVIDSTTFTYTVPNTLNTPAQGTIKASVFTRIAWAATAERADKFYADSGDSETYENWLFVVMGSKVVYKDGTVASDISASKNQNESYFYEAAQDFSVYLYLPSVDQVLGGVASDKAREYETFILKSIANYAFSSELVDINYNPTSYVGNESDIYNVAYYVHRYDFTAKGYIQEADTIDVNPGVPLEEVDASDRDWETLYISDSLPT
jgi:hypothetical protein